MEDVNRENKKYVIEIVAGSVVWIICAVLLVLIIIDLYMIYIARDDPTTTQQAPALEELTNTSLPSEPPSNESEQDTNEAFVDVETTDDLESHHLEAAFDDIEYIDFGLIS